MTIPPLHTRPVPLRTIHDELVRVIYSAEDNSVKLVVELPASDHFPRRSLTETYAVVDGKLVWSREKP